MAVRLMAIARTQAVEKGFLLSLTLRLMGPLFKMPMLEAPEAAQLHRMPVDFDKEGGRSDNHDRFLTLDGPGQSQGQAHCYL